MGEGKITLDIPDIDEKIAEIEEEIKKIRSTDPYMFQFVLTDDDAVKEKNSEFDEEYVSYEKYAGEG